MNNNDLNNVKKIISKLLLKQYITEMDIKELSKRNLNDVVNSYDKEDFKSKVLYTIYVNPFLLCDDDMLKNNPILDIVVIADILIKRFNEEVLEYQIQLSDDFITSEQYDLIMSQLTNQYFISTLIGRRIYHMFKEELKIACLDVQTKKTLKKSAGCAKI